MGNGYSLPERDPLGQVAKALRDGSRRLGEVETQRGTQLYDTIAELRSVVDNLAATIATLSSSGATWYGPVSTTGSVTANAGMSSVGVYGLDVSGLAGARRTNWTHVSGAIGYAPSTITKKANLVEFPIQAEKFLACGPVLFQYKALLEQRDNPDHPNFNPLLDVHMEPGHIAEWLIENDLGMFVFYDQADDGSVSPAGINYDYFAAVGFVVVGRAQQGQIDDLYARLERAGI